MEIWDAYYKDETPANIDLVRGEPIPDGLYHLVCEVLVRHTDGDYLLMQRDLRKPTYAGYYEATAGGAAQKGEGSLACIKRELYEETGIHSDSFTQINRRVYDNSIFYSFLCVTDCDKDSVTLQEGETISYKWLSTEEFARFVNSDRIIDFQKEHFKEYFTEMGFIG